MLHEYPGAGAVQWPPSATVARIMDKVENALQPCDEETMHRGLVNAVMDAWPGASASQAMLLARWWRTRPGYDD